MGIMQDVFGGSSESIGTVPGWEQWANNILNAGNVTAGPTERMGRKILRFFQNPQDESGYVDYSNAPGFAPTASAIRGAAAGAQSAAERGIRQRLAFENPSSGAALGASLGAESAGRIGQNLGTTMANALGQHLQFGAGAESQGREFRQQLRLAGTQGAGQLFLGAHPTLRSSTGGIIPGIASLMGGAGGMFKGIGSLGGTGGGG